MGGEVPREYYMSNTPPVPKEGMETLTLIAGAGGFKRLKFKVDLVGSALRYSQFCASLFLKDDNFFFFQLLDGSS